MAGLSSIPEAGDVFPCPLPLTVVLCLLLCGDDRGVYGVATGQRWQKRQYVNVPGESRSHGWVTRDKRATPAWGTAPKPLGGYSTASLFVLPSSGCSWRGSHSTSERHDFRGAQQGQTLWTHTLSPVPEPAGHNQHPSPALPTQPPVNCAGCYSRARCLHVEESVTGQALVRDQQLPKGERAG